MKTQIIEISKEECVDHIHILPFTLMKSNLEDIREESTHCYCAIVNDRIVGLHTIQRWPERIYLELYEVLPGFRGNKLQRKMTEFALQSLNPKDGTKINAFCISYSSWHSLMKYSKDYPEFEWDLELSAHLRRNLTHICYKCYSPITEHDCYCYRCGVPQRCPHCGERIIYPDATYCPACGKKLS